MKILHAAIIALALFGMPVAAATARQADTEAGFSTTDLMRASGVDLVFDQFGPSIAEAARMQQITADEHFLSTWERSANDVFDPAVMVSALEVAMTAAFTPAEMTALEAFYTSDFGRRIVDIEKLVLAMDSTAQITAVAEGMGLYAAPGETGPSAEQIDELMVLAGAELTPELVRQSTRGLMMGMSLVQESDIEVPWDAINEQLEVQMAGVDAQIRAYQQALTAYTYKDISRDDMETYLEFLRSAPSRRFYTVYVSAVSQIVSAAMVQFGSEFAQNLTAENT